jgi:hypothetical protein
MVSPPQPLRAPPHTRRRAQQAYLVRKRAEKSRPTTEKKGMGFHVVARIIWGSGPAIARIPRCDSAPVIVCRLPPGQQVEELPGEQTAELGFP